MNYMTVSRRPGRALSIWDDFDRVFDSFFTGSREVPEVRTPVTDVRETEKGLVMTAELPGFSPKDLDVKVEDNLLTIRAEHRDEKKDKRKDYLRQESREVRFERSFVLPPDIRSDQIAAEFKNGLLTLVLPKEEKPAPLSIEVKG